MGAKLKPGDTTISAGEWNRQVDVSDYVQNRFMLGDGNSRSPSSRDPNFVTVKNDSGADRRQGDLLEFTGFELTDLASRHILMKGGSPTLANGFGILQSPVKSGDFTEHCQVSGLCVSLVNISDTAHKYAKVNASTYVLQSCVWGPVRMVYQPNSTGERSCVVVIENFGPDLVWGKTDSSVLSGNTTTVSIWDGTPGSETDTNRDIASCYLRWGYIPSGVLVPVGLSTGTPHILGDYCTHIGKINGSGTLSKGNSGQFDFYNNETTTGQNVTAKALGADVPKGKWATGWQEKKSGNWYCACWES